MSGGMEMPGGWTMSMMWMPMPGQNWWTSAVLFLLMWLVMMVAMMLPSAIPMLRRHHLSRTGARAGISTMIVACGYFLVWMAIGVIVYVCGVLIAQAAMRSAALSRTVPMLIGAALALGGALQLSRWKMIGLKHCRDPQLCATDRKTGGGFRSEFSHGIDQGLYCALCCFGPMLVLVAIGTMNWVAMIIVAAIITAEKLFSSPQLLVRLTGIISLTAGIATIIRTLYFV